MKYVSCNIHYEKGGLWKMRSFKRKWTIDRTKYMTEPEVKELRRVVESKADEDLEHGRTTWPRFWMALDLAVSAGMRVSEIAHLRVGNLHLNNGEPRMRVLGKGQKVRDVFISDYLMKHLSDYLLWKRLMDEPMESEAFVLVSSHRKPYSPRTLQYAFKVCLREAGLPLHYSIHACRHSYGTILYRKTKNLRLVQKQLGHSSITTTTVYADVSAEEATEAVNGLFEGGDTKMK
jgi:site-specific recombinase XerD